MTTIINQLAAMAVIDYILETERGSYESWCWENDLTPSALTDNHRHVYAAAMLACGLTYEGDDHEF